MDIGILVLEPIKTVTEHRQALPDQNTQSDFGETAARRSFCSKYCFVAYGPLATKLTDIATIEGGGR
jgi:hypothetical protein